MSGEMYDLHFGSLKVGVVTENDRDFPNLWGDIVYDAALADPQTDDLARLSKFVSLNRESTRLMDLEEKKHTANDQPRIDAELKRINAELEAHYQEYVESEDWHLIDTCGCDQPILCPLLRGEGEIVWRWGLRGSSQRRRPASALSRVETVEYC